MRRASLVAAVLLAVVAPAAALGARPARPAEELPKFGVISRPKGFSTIRVIAAPGLSVFLDDEPRGTTEALRQGLFVEDLPAGTYTLRVEKAGFEPKVVTVTVAEGDTKEVRILGLKPKSTPTPVPAGWTPPPAAPPPPAPAPVRVVVLERRPVPGGTLVLGLASGPVDILPLMEDLRLECSCAPALEEVKKRKDGRYDFRIRLAPGAQAPAPTARPTASG